MRHIQPDQKETQELFNKEDNRATKEDINQLSVRINNTIEQLEVLAASLQSYKNDMQESVNTNQITAINAAISSLQTAESNLGDVEAENITGDSLAQITNLVAQIGTFTTDLTSPNATITDFGGTTLKTTNAYMVYGNNTINPAYITKEIFCERNCCILCSYNANVIIHQ